MNVPLGRLAALVELVELSGLCELRDLSAERAVSVRVAVVGPKWLTLTEEKDGFHRGQAAFGAVETQRRR